MRRLRRATRRPTPTRRPSTGSSPTPPTASAGRGSGSTWPATPTRPATAPTRSGTIWRYRDWVIDAFNAQPAVRPVHDRADRRRPAARRRRLEQRMATAFHRNTMTNTEGGTDDEEFRVAAVKDRVDTTGQVWMGLTIGCAKCHSHKYDPITQEEYYRLYAFFNQTADADQPDESPVIPAPTPALEEKIRRIDDQLAALREAARHPDARAGRRAGEVGSRRSARRPSGSCSNPLSARSEGGAALETLPDGSLQGERAPTPTAIPTPSSPGPTWPRSARSGSRPSPTRPCPASGTGRGAAGRFVLSRFGAEVAPDVEEKGPDRPVRPGRASRQGRRSSRWPRSRSSASGENVARGGAAEQSSTDYDGAAARAIDGKTDGHYYVANSTTHTRTEDNPWWEVRLAEPAAIERIGVWNRTDRGSRTGWRNFRVQVLDDDRKVVWQTEVAEPPKPQRELSTAGPRALAFSPGAGRLRPDRLRRRRHHRPEGRRGEVGLGGRAPAEGAARGRLRAQAAAGRPLAGAADVPPRASLEGAGRQPRPVPARGHQRPRRGALGRRAPRGPGGPRHARGRAHARAARGARPPLSLDRARAEAAPRRDRRGWRRSRPAIPNLPVMDELPADKRRETHLLHKGNFLDPGPTVEPGVPAALPPAARRARRATGWGWRAGSSIPKNPLTARVAVNRFWAQLFGVGLVETEEDFGTQGEPPSHPELLDWLAVEFMRLGLGHQGAAPADRHLGDLSPVVEGHARAAGEGPAQPAPGAGAAVPARGRDGPRPGAGAERPAEPQDRRPVGLSRRSPTASGRRRSTASGPGRPARATTATAAASTPSGGGPIPYPSMATFDAPSREICTVRAGPHEHAAPGVRDPERPGLRRGRAGPGAADRPRGGRRRRRPRRDSPCGSASAGRPSPRQVEALIALCTDGNTSTIARTAEAARGAGDRAARARCPPGWTRPSWPPGRRSPTCC